MQSPDISPATEEERRREFREASAALYGAGYPTLENLLHRARMAMADEQARKTEDLCRALGKVSPPGSGGV